MAPSSQQLRQGSIVWARVSGRPGKVKLRPLVVITATDEIVLDAPIVGVAITSTFPEPSPAQYVTLPWSADRHPATGLARRSAAVCNWLVELQPSDIEEIKGFVPTRYLLDILERVREFNPSAD